MLRRILAAGAAALAIATAGCLKNEITSTWYLESDLSVVWSVLERDVRSGERSVDARRRAEAECVTEARQHNQPAARGLRQFNPTSLGDVLNGLDKSENGEPAVFSLRWKDR